MTESARRWRVLSAGVAAGLAGFVSLAGNTASAEPVLPMPPAPVPSPVVQQAAPLAPAAAPAAAAVPGTSSLGVTNQTPGVPAATVPTGTVPTGAVPAAPAAVPQPAIVPATSGTLSEFLAEHGVKMEPQVADNFTALNIVLPMPTNWTKVPDPNVPNAFAVIADRTSKDLYTPNAQVVVYKLIGDFDPRAAISHGYVDSQKLLGWRTTDMAMGDFYGFPSSFIEGSYTEGSQVLNTSRRHVIATSGDDRYLVSLSVNWSAANQGISAAADATDAIVSGFRVSAPAPAPAAPPAAPAPVAPPALPALPQLPGLPG
ncbi:LpqN/LpqT family lipoprotein [Mycolicibacterium smegmatis]|uniref:Proline rich secreted protein Mtc28 n=4 Tax=Mycolicibacterium smegmatis TaxID=1772 RepID=I7GGA5_MYCS2|nr:LpqN/LpqT family lipoprotein [Mycolicibacterium smegmatis]ABK74018.1 proline-rich 28 kDa antigen [Mycolicibacterium smegmatis MC2 155]AFP43156.1 Proline rich secreted protein Mtc28 [Mycolicibacterium smegmatis MC2 155]AIU11871.1 proline-rich antigen [Mycolicibacterium smegmatis MC2 155]AIU18496.1 proline-rich antigen [Mycolicibacterium smegmatis]AIU25118.1 proline-rich antigen [Mycolicibacterium smegmatis]